MTIAAAFTRIITLLTAIATAVLPILADQHIVTPGTAAYIGTVLASIAVGYHGQTALLATTKNATPAAAAPAPAHAAPSSPGPTP